MKEIYISVLPSLPSTPRRVPSGHGTKSSILYLHSPTVRPKDIVRLSGDPLIQDSLTPCQNCHKGEAKGGGNSFFPSSLLQDMIRGGWRPPAPLPCIRCG